MQSKRRISAIVVTSGAVVLLVLVAALWVRPWEQVTAQEARAIPIAITEYRSGLTAEMTAGDPCSLTVENIGVSSFIPMHIVVSNQDGKVIAARDLAGVIDPFNARDYYQCVASFDLPVPDAEFYVVTLGDTYLRTIGAGDFPLEVGIGIDFEQQVDD